MSSDSVKEKALLSAPKDKAHIPISKLSATSTKGKVISQGKAKTSMSVKAKAERNLTNTSLSLMIDVINDNEKCEPC